MSLARILPFEMALLLYTGLWLVAVTGLVLAGVGHGYGDPVTIVGIVLFWTVVCAGPCLCMWGRKRLRRRYRIPGSDCSDCMAHTRWHFYALVQEARHVERGAPPPT